MKLSKTKTSFYYDRSSSRYTEIFFYFVDYFDRYSFSEHYTNIRSIKFILDFDSCVKTTVRTQHSVQVEGRYFRSFFERTMCLT